MDNAKRLDFIRNAVAKCTLADLGLPSTAEPEDVAFRRENLAYQLGCIPSVQQDLDGDTPNALSFTDAARAYARSLSETAPLRFPGPAKQWTTDEHGKPIERAVTRFHGG